MPASDPTPRARWLSWLGTLGDLARLRLLRLLERDELGVGELARALQLPQSTVSRHLKPLHDQGWVVKRTEGTQSLFRLVPDRLPQDMRELWKLSLDHLGTSPTYDEDDARLAEVLTARRVDSRTFFGRLGGDWDELRRQLFGEAFGADALLALLPADSVVADLGCGTGDAAERLAPYVKRVIAIDREPAMLTAAKRRLDRFGNIQFREGDIFKLPLQQGEASLIVMMLVLHHLEDPAAALKGVSKVLGPEGRALVVDMVRHDRTSYQHTMGHRHLGFAESELREMAKKAGMRLDRYTRLRPDTEGKGPGLFAALLGPEGTARAAAATGSTAATRSTATARAAAATRAASATRATAATPRPRSGSKPRR